MSPKIQRNIGLLIVAIVLVVMLALTWRTWPEPIIDFGRELYVPWQLSQGKVLYRDIAYFNGPLSPYFNALVFRVFGVSMMTLVWTNIAILIGILLMLHRLSARASDEVTATIACCAFLMLLAIGQPGDVGNYNYLTPYSQEMTHGLALSLAAIVCLTRFMETHKSRWIALCGALVGLVSLTKPEICFAAGASTLIGAFLATRESRNRWNQLVLFIACAAAVVLVALAMLCLGLPFRQSVAGILGGWRWTIDPRITGNPFYQWVRGTRDLDETFQSLVATTLGYLVLLGVPACIGWVISGDRASRGRQMGVTFACVATVLGLMRDFINWREIGRPLVLVAIIAVACHIYRPKDPRRILKLVFSLFALLMLAKIALYVQLYHYGFVLAAPALIVFVLSLFCWMPAWLNHHGGSGAVLRGSLLGTLLVTSAVYLYYENLKARYKTTQVGSGGDAFYAFREGEGVNRIVDRLNQLPPDATVAVVPQGVMINYLSRRTNSIPFIVQMPPEVIMFTQGRIIASFAAHPPDYVVYIPANTVEYGYRGYDVDFGLPIFDWIRENYTPIDGDPPHWTLLMHNVSADK